DLMRVLQLIDSLETGGAERMAVNYANSLVPYIDKSYLCCTRTEGPLKKILENEVGYLFLKRKYTLDIKAVQRLKNFVIRHEIQVVHAHGTSFFFATLLRKLYSPIVVIWHNHSFSAHTLSFKQLFLLCYCAPYFKAILCVNYQLENFCKNTLKHTSVFHVKNFVISPGEIDNTTGLYAGKRGKRIVCVANLRPEKNHGLLLDAFSKVQEQIPEANLHLFGASSDDIYAKSILEIAAYDIPQVHYHGVHENIAAILSQFDIGTLSSDSEGLPLALLEYGMAGLPVVVTDVGHCCEVIENNGSCVKPGNARAFADAIINYLNNLDLAKATGSAFQRQILANYGTDVILPQVVKIYGESLKKL
ncbi:MAG: glycosyltransferase family 4 protein, partial [Leeuwenhoekiella sp.]